MSSGPAGSLPSARGNAVQNAREALSAALASMPKAAVRRVFDTVDEEHEPPRSNGSFKKLKTGKGWASHDTQGGDEPSGQPLPATREGEDGRRLAQAAGHPRADQFAAEAMRQKEVSEPPGSPQQSKPKMQLLKNRMRRNFGNASAPAMEGMLDTVPEDLPEGPKQAAQGGAGRAKPQLSQEDRPIKPRSKAKPKAGRGLGARSAFLSYQGQAANGNGQGEPPAEEEEAKPKGRPSNDGSRPTDQAAQVLHALQQRQVWWQGRVKHKMGSSMVELFHLAATIPAEVAEQFPPSLYVSELKHRSEVVLTDHMWVKCSARSLTEKQSAKLHLLTDNKLVAVIRLQHCELILVPDMDPASSSIRTAGFLLANPIYN